MMIRSESLKLHIRDAQFRIPTTFSRGVSQTNQAAADDVVQRITESGGWIEEGYFDSSLCTRSCNTIDELIKRCPDCVWSDRMQSDHRIFGANLLTDQFDYFYKNDFVETVIRKYMQSKPTYHFIMCARMNFVPDNEGSGEGWHRDSPYSHQFKAILYLSDVDEATGPFEYILGTHTTRSMRDLDQRDALKLGEYRFSSERIAMLQKMGALEPSNLFPGKCGTLLMGDVRGLHRGAPLRKGCRFALTHYFINKRTAKSYAEKYPHIGNLEALSSPYQKSQA